MKTSIIPEIKQITPLENDLIFENFYLDQGIISILPVAKEIFAENEMKKPVYPIIYTPAPMGAEEYKITARQTKIEIQAMTNRGLMYALFTLSELALVNDGFLSEFDAQDSPSLSLRALSDDISRRQIPNFDSLIKMIKRLARYKYNVYMPYIEDVFKYKCFPEWSRGADGISADEWKAIIRFASSYYVDIRPIVNLLGHMDKVCTTAAVYPMVIKRNDGAPTSVLDPTNSKVREIIPQMLKEIVDCFGEGTVHCGGDEPAALTEEFGEAKAAELFISHYKFIHDELKKLNCKMMIYVDFFAPPWGDDKTDCSRVNELPDDIEFVFWDYGVREHYPLVDKLHSAKVKLIISPSTWTYHRFSCDIKTSFGNTKGLLATDNGRSLGMIMSHWGDGSDTLRENMWPGVVVGANFSWRADSCYSYEEWYDIYHKSFFGFDHDEAVLLDPIYHHDEIVQRTDQHEFKAEFFRKPTELVSYAGRENVQILLAALRKAEVDFKSLKPLRNQSAYDVLELTIVSAICTAHKIAEMPHEKSFLFEDRQKCALAALRMTGEILAVKALLYKLWSEENRMSEWTFAANRYDELYAAYKDFGEKAFIRLS